MPRLLLVGETTWRRVSVFLIIYCVFRWTNCFAGGGRISDDGGKNRWVLYHSVFFLASYIISSRWRKWCKTSPINSIRKEQYSTVAGWNDLHTPRNTRRLLLLLMKSMYSSSTHVHVIISFIDDDDAILSSRDDLSHGGYSTTRYGIVYSPVKSLSSSSSSSYWCAVRTWLRRRSSSPRGLLLGEATFFDGIMETEQ